MAPRGASFVVVLLTEGMAVVGLSLIEKERSKMALYGRDLCGTMATGEIFSCFGGSCLISAHRTSFACPFLHFSATSVLSCLHASGIRAEICGPLSIAAWI